MNGEAAREYVQTHCIVYEHERDEQQQDYENSKEYGYLAYVLVEGFYEGLLVVDFVHHRRFQQVVLYHLAAVRGYVVGLEGEF